MELKDLTALGITEEQANKVLEQHTAELTAEQQKYTDLNAELETAKARSQSLLIRSKHLTARTLKDLRKRRPTGKASTMQILPHLSLTRLWNCPLPEQKQEMWTLSSLSLTRRSSSLTMTARSQVLPNSLTSLRPTKHFSLRMVMSLPQG